jgi:HAD superfamily hydrolase (TIGR01509 family)
MKDIKLVAFDCDGVLFDTAATNRAYYNQVLTHFNRPEMTDEQFRYAHMHTSHEAICYLFGEEEAIQAAMDYAAQMTYLPFIQIMKMEPHLLSLLNKIRPPYKTAIATNRTNTMERVLDAHDLKKHFDLVVTAWDVDRPKPHPDALIKILTYFRLKPKQVLYIGDSEVDEVSARAAGVWFAAFQNDALDADFYIESLKEVEPILGI